MQIIDRRKVALGGQSHTRTRSKITAIAWHYTAVARKNKAFITNHETYWRNHHGWKRGGYHFYIDADGKIYQNYDYETVSNGVGGNNSYVVNICVEADSADDYSQAQVEARDWLTRKVMKELNIPASRVMGHKEFPGQSTACPGYSKAQMDAFRRDLGSGELVSTKPIAKPAAKPVTKPVAKNPESIVDYLNSIKVDSSPTNRKKIAAAHGIKNYTGTAAQNTQLLELIKKNGVEPKKVESKPASASYKGDSIVDYLNSIKIGSSFSNRKRLADQYGIKNYKGTASQNTALLNAMQKSGATTTKPKSNYAGSSLVDYLKSINVDSNFANRKKLAAQYGVNNYSGTAAQNSQLLNKMR